MNNRWLKSYQGWKRLVGNITEDCDSCNNERYYFDFNMNGDIKVCGCPVCNWDDLSRRKDANIDMPLHLFPIWLKDEQSMKL